MDALPGDYLALSAVAALIVLAVALPVAGLIRLLGPPGAGIAALLFIAIGNPGSGNASAPELLPGFWRVAGQLLPPGAGGQALRTTAYFDAVGARAAAARAGRLGAGRRRPDRARAAPRPERRARAAAAHAPRRGPGMSRNRARAAAGSALFFALAPGVVAGRDPLRADRLGRPRRRRSRSQIAGGAAARGARAAADRTRSPAS